MSDSIRKRIAVAALSVSIAGIGAWMNSEGFADKPMIPTKGDVPTIGFGSTRYEDGRAVNLTDPPITRQRAEQLARNLMSKDEQRFRASLGDVELFQDEYDLYLNFVGQFGSGNWQKPKSPRTWLLKRDYRGACEALLNWRFQAERDCSLPKNWGPQGCRGVWTRQQERHAKCIATQGARA